MSRKRTKHYRLWVEQGSNQVPQDPRIYGLLPPLILELVLVEDATGPSYSKVVREEYIAKLALDLRAPIARALEKAHIDVRNFDLAEICRLSAGEAFVLRGLNQARIAGEVVVEDFRHLPFFRTYQAYLEQTPEIVARSIEISAAAAEQGGHRKGSQN